MAQKYGKWATLAGSVLIVIAGTSLLCTEPSAVSKESASPTTNKQKPVKQQKPETPPPQFNDEDLILDMLDLDKDIVKLFEQDEKTPRKERMGQQKPDMPPPSMGNENSIDDKEAFKFLEQFDPERLKQLKHLKEADPEAYSRMMKDTKREIMRMNDLKERDPERFEQMMKERQMEKEVKELSLQYRKSQNNDEKETIKKQIKTNLEKLFDFREAKREEDIKRMEQELNKLKEKMKSRKANRDKIIERHEKEMLGEEDDLGW
jgi:hypothetical protein